MASRLLRFTGSAVEMVEAAALARTVERGDAEISDVVVELPRRREVGTDIAASRQGGRHAGLPPAPAPARRAEGRRSRQTPIWYSATRGHC